MKFLFLALALLGFGCTKTAEVDLRISVRDSQGQLISGAQVKLDGEAVGASGADGTFSLQLKLKRDERYKVEVTKASSEFYFAPFYDSFGVDDVEKLPVNLEAVLYAVPKPSPEEQAEIEREQPTLAENKPAAETPAVETKVTDAATPSPAVEETAPTSVASTPTIAEEVPSVASAADAPIVLTVHAFEGERPLKDASIAFAHDDQTLFEPGCKTNERGRCVIRFTSVPLGAVKFVARATGFQTQVISEKVAHQGLIKFVMQRGASIEVLAQSRTYNRIAPIAGIGVEINGKKAGVTDAFGHYLQPYRGKRTDLVPVVLTSEKMLPAKYETDFVVAGPVQLVKQFTAKRPVAARVAILNLQTSGDVRNTQLYQPSLATERQMAKSLKKFMVLRGGFQEVALSRLRVVSKQEPTRITKALMRGWAGTKYAAELDFVFLPTLVVGDPMMLEVAVVGAHGQVVAAATDVLTQVAEPGAVDDAVAAISERLYDIFPFQAAVIEANKNEVATNAGAVHRLGLKPGDEADVFGTQNDADGRTQSQVKIARVKMKTITKDQSVATVTKLEPRSAIQLGDMVVFRASREPAAPGSEVRVYGSLPGGRARSLAQANVYLGEKWVGATDVNGKLQIDAASAQKGKTWLRVIKPGHRAYAKEITFPTTARQEITIVRDSASVDIDAGTESIETVLGETNDSDKRVQKFAAECSNARLVSDAEQAQQRERLQSFKAWFDTRNTFAVPVSAQTNHSAFYYMAYCQHRLWEASKDVVLLPNVVAAWRDYQSIPSNMRPAANGAESTEVQTAQKMSADAEAALNKVISFRGN